MREGEKAGEVNSLDNLRPLPRILLHQWLQRLYPRLEDGGIRGPLETAFQRVNTPASLHRIPSPDTDIA